MPTPPLADIPPELAALAEYTDLRPLGQGGMGVVYAGTQALMNRPVVLKVMTPAAEGAEAATERFLREIRAAAALDHPHVVKAYAAHRAGRRLVFVMEYVPGDDLGKVIDRRGPLPVANACYYAYQAALGLQHAHERGLVHRDIKPGNLLLAKAFGKTAVKVADFGLAKAARERDHETGLTGDGRLMGTPHYLAPEQALDAARADIRADIYSLGCTLYHLLAGRPPFAGGSLIALVDAHRSATPTSLDALRPEVPAGLAAVVGRMMAKAPADRFQTPAEAARALVPFFKPAGGSAEATPVQTDATPAKSSPSIVVRPAVVTAIPLDPPPPPPPVVSHWKPPTVFRGTSVPHDTAYLNAEDFNPATSKPPKPPRKKKPKETLRVGPLVGVAVAVAAVVVGGVAAVVALRDKPAVADAATPPAEAVPPVTPAPPAAAFVPLFNGRDLTGWRVDPSQPGGWAVVSGVLTGSGPDTSHLFTTRDDFSNFVLRVEGRVNTRGNGGVHLRTPFGRVVPADAPKFPGGHEVEIASTWYRSKTGTLMHVASTNPPGVPRAADNEWFTLEVTAIGPRLRTVVNGHLTSEYTDPGTGPARGHIALQQYLPESVVEFRKVEVKELPADAVMPPAPGPPAADGFEPLFNGRDLSDWSVPFGTPDNWTAANGLLVARGGTAASHLFHNRVYSDFHLRTEFRVNAAGNSGVYFRAAPGSPYPSGYEAQINPTDRNGPATGGLYLNNRVVDPGGTPGGTGEWTTLEVIAVGRSVTVKVNGTTTSTHTGSGPSGGRIALQHHNPQTVIEFRRVEVKPLEAPPPAPAAPRAVVPTPATPKPSAPTKGELASPDAARRRATNDNRWFAGGGKELVQVEGKELVLIRTDKKSGWPVFGDPDWTDYDFSARVRGAAGPGLCLLVRSNYSATGQLRDGRPDYQHAAGMFTLGWRDNSMSTVEGYTQADGYIGHDKVPGLQWLERPNLVPRGAWVTVTVKVRGEVMETYLNGQKWLAGKPPMPARGMVGLRVVDVGSVRFADLKVTDPAGKVLFEGLPDLPK